MALSEMRAAFFVEKRSFCLFHDGFFGFFFFLGAVDDDGTK